MIENLILPPTFLTEILAPLIFLAGPIQGAYDWQKDVIEFISSKMPELYIASPRRNIAKRADFSVEMYNEQVDWESYHLRKAADRGCVLFWCAKEYEHNCYRSYAQTTRSELFEWKVFHQWNGAKLALGIEQGYTGSRYI